MSALFSLLFLGRHEMARESLIRVSLLAKTEPEMM